MDKREGIRRGGELSKSGEYALAIEAYSRVLEEDPANEGAYLGRGIALMKSGRLEGAIGDYSQAILLRGGGSVAYLGRGIARLQLGEYARAIDDISRAIEEDSSNAIAYVNRGNIYLKVKENERAIEDYSRATTLDFHYTRTSFLCKIFFYLHPALPPPRLFFFLSCQLLHTNKKDSRQIYTIHRESSIFYHEVFTLIHNNP